MLGQILTSETSKHYLDLPDRNYTFQVRAKDHAGSVMHALCGSKVLRYAFIEHTKGISLITEKVHGKI